MYKRNFSYDAYQWLELLPFLLFVLVFCSYFVSWMSLRVLCLPKTVRTVFIKHIQLLPLIAEALFGPPQGVFSYESARSFDTHKTFILTMQLKRNAYFVLSGMGIALLMNASIIFWELFLFEVSYICDDSIDCFNETTTSRTLITNCSLYDEDSDVIKCFKFTFAFGTGLAAFGGLITSIQLVVQITTKSSVWIYSRIRHTAFHRVLSHCCFKNVFLISVVIIFFPTGIYVYYLLALNPAQKLYFIFFDIFRFLINVAIVVAGIWIPWFLVTERVETDEERGGDTEEQDDDEQPQDTGIRQSLVTAVTDYGSTN